MERSLHVQARPGRGSLGGCPGGSPGCSSHQAVPQAVPQVVLQVPIQWVLCCSMAASPGVRRSPLQRAFQSASAVGSAHGCPDKLAMSSISTIIVVRVTITTGKRWSRVLCKEAPTMDYRAVERHLRQCSL